MSERVLDIWVTLDTVRGVWCASNFITINLNSFWSTGSFSASYLKLSMILGVWRVSGRCLGVFWVTLDNGVQAIDEHSIGLIFMSWFFFTRLPRISQNVPYFGVSGGCLGCIWRLSGMYLEDSGYNTGDYDTKSVDNSSIWNILISCNVFSQWPIFGDLGPKMRNFKFNFTSEGVLKSKFFQLKLALKLNFLSESKWTGQAFHF